MTGKSTIEAIRDQAEKVDFPDTFAGGLQAAVWVLDMVQDEGDKARALIMSSRKLPPYEAELAARNVQQTFDLTIAMLKETLQAIETVTGKRSEKGSER